MDASLPRRPILGLELSGFDDRGMIVARARPGSMGEEAGVVAGDVIVAIDEQPVRSLRELRAVLARVGEDATFTLATGKRRSARVHRRPMDGSVLYDTIDGRLRALVTKPARRAPAVLLIQGISLASIEDSAAFTALAAAFPELVTMRVDKRGVGDSLGEIPDFVDEVADFRAALAQLARYEFVDPNEIYVFGHSVGGMIAPLLDGVARIAVYGTTATRWFECLDASARRQAELRGLDQNAAVEHQRAVIARDEDERSKRYHEQLDALDLREAWRRVRSPTVSLHGEFDWVVSADDAREITGTFRELPGLDHALTRHASLAASLESYGRGAIDPASFAEIARGLLGERTWP